MESGSRIQSVARALAILDGLAEARAENLRSTKSLNGWA